MVSLSAQLLRDIHKTKRMMDPSFKTFVSSWKGKSKRDIFEGLKNLKKMIKLYSDGTVEVEARCFLIVVQEGPLEEFIKHKWIIHLLKIGR